MTQVLLIICAISLLSVLTLSVNGTFLAAVSTSIEAQAQLTAFSLSQNLMDEILSKAFDEATVGGKEAFDTTVFTQSKYFGSEAGESLGGIDSTGRSFSQFDDVDDYHNYTRVVRDSVLDYFTITCRVTYVSREALDREASGRTFLKAITVTAAHPNFPQDNSGNIVPVVFQEIAVSRKYL
ncbi:MAG: hypothetical protein MN733_33010 [Nitrososphaera sp.]|nr:hypothetical protein [Nitrososphaera sp.]MCI0707005.1 hypothetical protein [Ignavibacteriota bacterium]